MQKIFKLLFAISAFFILRDVDTQTISIKGQVVDNLTNKPLNGVKLTINRSSVSATTNENGQFELTGLEPGFYAVYAELEGYKNTSSYEQLFTFDKQSAVLIEMESLAQGIGSVEIRRSSLQKEMLKVQFPPKNFRFERLRKIRVVTATYLKLYNLFLV